MRLLLDTHVFIWMQSDPERLGSVLSTVRMPSTQLLVSAAVAWEVAIKAGLGKIALPEPVRSWMPERIARIGADPVAIRHEDALAVADLPLLHRDPFDRLLVCQSRTLRAPIVTADPAIEQYDVEVLQVA